MNRPGPPDEAAVESDKEEPERPGGEGDEPAGTPAGGPRKERRKEPRKERRKKPRKVPMSGGRKGDSRTAASRAGPTEAASETTADPIPPADVDDDGDDVLVISLDDDDDTPIEETILAILAPARTEVAQDANAEVQGDVPARTSEVVVGRPTIDAELSSPAARARLVAQALAHSENRDARYRLPMEAVTATGWRGALSLGIVLLALSVAVAPPSFVVPEPLTLPDDVERVRGARIAIHLQARQIEAFRARNERLPFSLDEIGQPVPGVRFVRSDGRIYQLVAYGPGGQPIILDSAAPAPFFDSIAAAISALDGTP